MVDFKGAELNVNNKNYDDNSTNDNGGNDADNTTNDNGENDANNNTTMKVAATMAKTIRRKWIRR